MALLPSRYLNDHLFFFKYLWEKKLVRKLGKKILPSGWNDVLFIVTKFFTHPVFHASRYYLLFFTDFPYTHTDPSLRALLNYNHPEKCTWNFHSPRHWFAFVHNSDATFLLDRFSCKGDSNRRNILLTPIQIILR